MSTFKSSQTFEIERPTGRCAVTDRELEPGETYFATLIELTPEQIEALPDTEAAAKAMGLKRLDVCEQAWQQHERPDNLFGFWKTTVPEPSQRRKLFVDDAILMNLLKRLDDATEPDRLAFRYVLALILMRKKLLRYDRLERRDAEVEGETVQQEWWVMTPKLDVTKGHFGKWNEEETVDVLDPKLDESRIEQVTQQLGQILEAEL